MHFGVFLINFSIFYDTDELDESYFCKARIKAKFVQFGKPEIKVACVLICVRTYSIGA